MPNETLTLAGLFFACGAGIALYQRRGATCPRHSRWAGTAAWALAGCCGIVGAVLLYAALA
jgi:hypothetical protein